MKTKKQILQERLDEYDRRRKAEEALQPDRSFHRKLIIRKFRNESQQPSRWLPKSIVADAPAASALCFCINDPANLASLIYENETKKYIKFTFEGLIKTYPTKKFIQQFKSMVDKHVPDELKSLMFADIGSDLDGIQQEKVYMHADRSKEVDGISAMLTIVLPLYKKDIEAFQEKFSRIVDFVYIDGYDLAAVSQLEHSKRDDVIVLLVQFEARFSNDKFKLADVLLHVAPYNVLEKIKKNGLVPKSKSSEFKYEDRVYLFNQCTEDLAVKYGLHKARQCKSRKFCIFRILKKNLENDLRWKNGKLRLYADTAFADDNGIDVEAVFTYGNVPPDLLEDICLVYDANDIAHPQKLKFK